jgi:hypothetical protein
MQAPNPQPQPIEVPDDVKAELTQPEAAAKAQPAKSAVPIPEDVLAEADAEIRAATPVPGDDATIPVALDDESER